MDRNRDAAAFNAESSRPPQIRPTHLQRLAVVYARQSSEEQVRDHAGSAAAQLDQAELARRWGWPEAQVVINKTDLGLSGTAISNRPGLLELLAPIGRGE